MAKDFVIELDDEPAKRDEDADPEIDVEDDEKLEDKPLEYGDDDPNLVPLFMKSEKGRKACKRIADQVYKDFTEAQDGSKEYRERFKEDWSLFTGELQKKSFPYENCANAHVPILLENILRLHARTYAELFGDWQNVFGVLPVGPDDDEVAEILTKHGNWQINTQLTDFKRQQDRALLLFLVAGDASAHSFYDDTRKRNVHETLTVDEIVVPYVFTTVQPDYSDVPFVGKVIHRYRHELERMKKDWYDVDSVINKRKPSWDDDPEDTFRIARAEAEGIVAPDDDTRAPYKLIWYEGWLELPERDRSYYCKVILDHATKAILLLQILEEDDWQDKIRHMRQQAELDAYRGAKQTYETQFMAVVQQQQQVRDEILSGALPPHEAEMVLPALEQAQPPPPPEPPAWAGPNADDPMFEPEPIRRVPIHMFSHGVCIEPLVSSRGIGYGRMLADHNRAANTALSQFIDAATLGNAWSLLIPQGVELERPLSISPGSVNKVKNIAPADLRNAIMELKAAPANGQLLDIVRMASDFGSSSAQSPDVLSGEAGKSGETYRGIATRVEQATKQLGVFAGKFADMVTQVLRNNARLNAQFLPDEEIVYINNHKMGTVEELKIGRHLYERDYRVVISSDLRFASQAQRISEADEIVGMGTSIQPLSMDVPFMWNAIANSLKARGREDMVPQLGPRPPPPMVPFGMQPAMPGQPPGAPGAPAPGGAAPMPDSGGGGGAPQPAIPDGGPVEQGQPEPVQGVGGPMMPPS